MKDYILYLFILLVITIPFLYRFINVGNPAWFVVMKKPGEILNYNQAEKFRIIQVLLGFSYFVYHGIMYWGWNNLILLIILTFFISMSAEIIGSKTGLIFGGKYQYNVHKTPGYMMYNIPLLIPIAWFGLIYMALNLYSAIMKVSPSTILSGTTSHLIILSSVMVVALDLVLDPIAVNENRWSWKFKGRYYGVPILNFFGWFSVAVLIIMIFSVLRYPVVYASDQNHFMMKYSPGILFLLLHIIAARPCFERGLIIPGTLGLIFAAIYLYLIYIQYQF